MDPSGIFPTSYRTDRRVVRTRWQMAALALFVGLMLAAPYLVSGRIVAILNMMMISAVIAVGLQICTGYAGQINLGQAAFMGVGAYTAAILASKTGLTFLLTIPLAGLSAALFGFLFGLTAARIKGFYLAIATLAAQFFLVWLFEKWSWLYNDNASGAIQVPNLDIFGLYVSGPQADSIVQYYLVLFIVCLLTWVCINLTRGRPGRTWKATRDMDIAAELIGIDLIIALVVAGTVGTLGWRLVRKRAKRRIPILDAPGV